MTMKRSLKILTCLLVLSCLANCVQKNQNQNISNTKAVSSNSSPDTGPLNLTVTEFRLDDNDQFKQVGQAAINIDRSQTVTSDNLLSNTEDVKNSELKLHSLI